MVMMEYPTARVKKLDENRDVMHQFEQIKKFKLRLLLALNNCYLQTETSYWYLTKTLAVGLASVTPST
jgi:hypothetical protein